MNRRVGVNHEACLAGGGFAKSVRAFQGLSKGASASRAQRREVQQVCKSGAGALDINMVG